MIGYWACGTEYKLNLLYLFLNAAEFITAWMKWKMMPDYGILKKKSKTMTGDTKKRNNFNGYTDTVFLIVSFLYSSSSILLMKVVKQFFFSSSDPGFIYTPEFIHGMCFL